MYNAAIYVRCSKYNEKKENSLVMQKSIANKYVESKPDIVVYKEYVDNGYSGLDFFRPGFQSMLYDIDNGIVNCIIVKDLSRLGRDYIETGRYIQYIFPSMGIRLISICDGYDSETATEVENNFMIPIRNYINDMYSKDISNKVRIALDVRRKNGYCTLNKVTYGYIKDNNQILIDEEVRGIIKDIFEYSLEGYSLQGIADILNKKGISTPMEHGGHKTPFRTKEVLKWYPMMVKRILTDEIYTGTLVQGKTKKIGYKKGKRKEIKSEGWYRMYNNHEKIIDKKTFEIVNRLLKHDVRCRRGMDKCHNLAGFIKCGICNNSMIYRKTNNKKDKYICRLYNRGIGCNKISISVEDVNEIVDRLFKTTNRRELAYIIKNIYIYKDDRLTVEIYSKEDLIYGKTVK